MKDREDTARPPRQTAPTGEGSDVLRQNLSRVPEGDPALAPDPGLQERLKALQERLLPSLGERLTPQALCYNDPTSESAELASPPQPRPANRPPSPEGEPMKLQACTKCGAQFDVSSFSPGDQFTCGDCGTVLTAGAAPASKTPGSKTSAAGPRRVPGSQKAGGPRSSAGTRSAAGGPSKGGPSKGRTPGGSVKRTPRSGAAGSKRTGAGKTVGGKPVVGAAAAGPRGPQYKPVQRAGQGGQAASKSTSAARKGPSGRRAPPTERRARGAEGEEGGRSTKAGPNKGLLVGAGAVVLIVVIAMVMMGGKNTDSDGGGGGGGTKVAETPKAAPEPTETARDVMGEYGTRRPTMLKHYRGFINRLQALESDEAKTALRTVYEDFIKGPGRDDKKARTFLGYKEFDYEVPEDIPNREYAYIEAVTAAYNHHWYGADEKEEYEIALRAKKKTEEHFTNYVEDHRFRAADGIRSNIAKDKFFKDYNYVTRWADPYLICYSSKDRLTEYELLSIEDKDERRMKLKEIRKRQAEFEKVLDEKAAIFTQLYKNFMGRYEKSLDLKPLMDEYGGRPDYPIGVRSFQDGAPLVVWIFDNQEAFNEYHSKVKKELVPHNVAGYFSPRTTYVYLYDEKDNPSNRVFEINKNVHEGTHQLEFWFTRQRNRWAKPLRGQDFFGEGIAEYVGAVQMKPDRTLEFIGVNVPRLRGMQQQAKILKSQGGEYKLFPVDKLCEFASYGQVKAWGAREWGLHPDMVLGMFYQQSWAFVYFLNEYKDGQYKERFEKFFNLVLHRETGGSTGDAAFKEAFRIRDEDDWEDINDEFHAYITDKLMKLDINKWKYTPPARGETSEK